MLPLLPQRSERLQSELRLLTVLGPALMAAKGYAAAEVEQTYTRIRDLCEQAGETRPLCQAVMGLWMVANACGYVRRAQELGEHLLRLAEREPHGEFRLRAESAMGQACFPQGKFALAHTHLVRSITLYAPEPTLGYRISRPCWLRSWAKEGGTKRA